MNIFSRSLCMLSLGLFITAQCHSQVLNENFNSGLPLNWTQSPAGSWTLGTTYNQTGTGCAVTEEIGSNSLTATFSTSPLNLSAVTNLSLTFKASFTKNNFLPPNLAIYYDAGAGPQFLARWGSGFTAPTTYTIIESANYVHPLQAQNVLWQNCTHTFSPINSNSVRFLFSAEIINGGYFLLDEVQISGQTSNTLTTRMAEQHETTRVQIYPNPVTNKKLMIHGSKINRIYLTNFSGLSVKTDFESNGGDNYQVDLSNFSPGVYTLNVVCEDQSCNNLKLIIE